MDKRSSELLATKVSYIRREASGLRERIRHGEMPEAEYLKQFFEASEKVFDELLSSHTFGHDWNASIDLHLSLRSELLDLKRDVYSSRYGSRVIIDVLEEAPSQDQSGEKAREFNFRAVRLWSKMVPTRVREEGFEKEIEDLKFDLCFAMEQNPSSREVRWLHFCFWFRVSIAAFQCYGLVIQGGILSFLPKRVREFLGG